MEPEQMGPHSTTPTATTPTPNIHTHTTNSSPPLATISAFISFAHWLSSKILFEKQTAGEESGVEFIGSGQGQSTHTSRQPLATVQWSGEKLVTTPCVPTMSQLWCINDARGGIPPVQSHGGGTQACSFLSPSGSWTEKMKLYSSWSHCQCRQCPLCNVM